MARYELLMTKMGKSGAEAKVIKWVKEVGDAIEADEAVLEIATDKVDSDVPSPVSGKLLEQRFKENDVVQVGDVIAILETDEAPNTDNVSSKEDGDSIVAPDTSEVAAESEASQDTLEATSTTPGLELLEDASAGTSVASRGESGRFYSPLVRSIAESEGISMEELESIAGSGAEGRVTKSDGIAYLAQKTTGRSEERRGGNE